jgi:hypothetical protein
VSERVEIDPAVLDAAHADYLAGVTYDELRAWYGVSEKRLVAGFRERGLRGGRGRRTRQHQDQGGCVGSGDPYGLLILHMMGR